MSVYQPKKNKEDIQAFEELHARRAEEKRMMQEKRDARKPVTHRSKMAHSSEDPWTRKLWHNFMEKPETLNKRWMANDFLRELG